MQIAQCGKILSKVVQIYFVVPWVRRKQRYAGAAFNLHGGALKTMLTKPVR